MSDTHSNAHEKVSDLKLEHLSDFDWNRCPICFRTGVRHELESLSDLACSTQPSRLPNIPLGLPASRLPVCVHQAFRTAQCHTALICQYQELTRF